MSDNAFCEEISEAIRAHVAFKDRLRRKTRPICLFKISVGTKKADLANGCTALD